MAEHDKKSWWREIILGVVVAVISAIVVARLGLDDKGAATGQVTKPGADAQKKPKKVRRVVRGDFRSVHGQTGHISFGVTFVSPPKVELSASHRVEPIDKPGGVFFLLAPKGVRDHTIITDTSTVGFRWKNVAETTQNDEVIAAIKEARQKPGSGYRNSQADYQTMYDAINDGYVEYSASGEVEQADP